MQTEPGAPGSALFNLYSGIQEEFATMLRQVLWVLSE